YLNRPAMTAERFVPDPFGARPGSRLYRTGDLVRLRADGSIEFLGRLDDQVKIRGFRIELGEIESVLKQDPTVREAVVVAREDSPGDQRLVAYLVEASPGGGAVSIRGLQRRVAETLPEHMAPSAYVALEALPLTPSGKLDRRALPAPDGRPAETPYAPPRNEIEEVLARIWGEILGVQRFGINDDFFALGGHSLKATRVVSRVYDAFGVSLPLRRFFTSSTIARLAIAVEQLLVEEIEQMPEEEAQRLVEREPRPAESAP